MMAGLGAGVQTRHDVVGISALEFRDADHSRAQRIRFSGRQSLQLQAHEASNYYVGSPLNRPIAQAGPLEVHNPQWSATQPPNQ